MLTLPGDDFSIDAKTSVIQIAADNNDCITDHCVRVYKVSPGFAAIQVRSHSGARGDGKRFLVAHASLTRRELWAFRDHINAVLEEM